MDGCVSSSSATALVANAMHETWGKASKQHQSQLGGSYFAEKITEEAGPVGTGGQMKWATGWSSSTT